MLDILYILMTVVVVWTIFHYFQTQTLKRFVRHMHWYAIPVLLLAVLFESKFLALLGAIMFMKFWFALAGFLIGFVYVGIEYLKDLRAYLKKEDK